MVVFFLVTLSAIRTLGESSLLVNHYISNSTLYHPPTFKFYVLERIEDAVLSPILRFNNLLQNSHITMKNRKFRGVVFIVIAISGCYRKSAIFLTQTGILDGFRL